MLNFDYEHEIVECSWQAMKAWLILPKSIVIVRQSFKCRYHISHAGLELLGRALLLATYAHSVLYNMESLVEMKSCLGDDAITYWMPVENEGFVKQVVRCKLYIELKMKLSAIRK